MGLVAATNFRETSALSVALNRTGSAGSRSATGISAMVTCGQANVCMTPNATSSSTKVRRSSLKTVRALRTSVPSQNLGGVSSTRPSRTFTS